MNSIPWFQEWFGSPFYHKLQSDRNEEEAAAFIGQLVQRLSPAPKSRMVDIACGRGSYSKLLAEMGFEVTGIDFSAENIGIAKAFETDQLEFFIHDMRLPFWGNYFNYAFSFFTSFGYFRTRREHDDLMRTTARSLQPGGLFVIDYLNVHYAEDHLVSNETKQLGDTQYDIHRWQDETHFYKKIVITDPALPAPPEYTEEIQKFSLGDFTDMLSYQGLQVQEVFGDYQFNAYDTRKTERMIVVGKKL